MNRVARTDAARASLYQKYKSRIEVNQMLSRSLVSYQANRKCPYYRWFKYKEGFSAPLVKYALETLRCRRGRLLDPFAGTGAALFVARDEGLDSLGIELLPIGFRVIQARLAAEAIRPATVANAVETIRSGEWKDQGISLLPMEHLRITKDAFPKSTERQIAQFRGYLSAARMSGDLRLLLEMACLSVLEAVSYTRKDGQYLRWDHRSPRNLRGKPFDKGPIPTFETAILRQLEMMAADVQANSLFGRNANRRRGAVQIVQGSVLDVLPTIQDSDFDVVVTSPPYCNRYDYTRTYALELAYLGISQDRLRGLRQSLLSCTVENLSKRDYLQLKYARLKSSLFSQALAAFESQEALHEVLDILDAKGADGLLNNTNVPRMVRNYFLEMAVVVFELARAVKPGGHVVMINDNVRYGGEEVPVDLILCELAAAAGFATQAIWTLARGKGNSSQQMGSHGRSELRKCVYVWRR